MKALVHTGDSANISYYGEPVSELLGGRIWVQVMRSITWSQDRKEARDEGRFHFWVYEQGVGEIGDFEYRPRNPGPGRLPDDVVTKRVRRFLRHGKVASGTE